MPHRIVLTGMPVTPLRKKANNLFTFDMREEGSKKPAPKGLWQTGPIYYTVVCNLRQINRSGLDRDKFEETRLLIEGEPTFDLPQKYLTGQIGVVCRVMQLLELDDERNSDRESNHQEAPVQNETILLPIEQIVIPEDFLQFTPRREKIQQKIDYFLQNQRQERPIPVQKDNTLVDGYTIYLAAKELKKPIIEVILTKD